MESVKFNIEKHGRVASTRLLSDCVIGMTHSDGYAYAVALPDTCEHGELIAVTLLEPAGQGMVLRFDDRHEQTIFFAALVGRRVGAPAIVPSDGWEARVREFAL